VSQVFERHVYAVQQYVKLTNPRYAPLLDSQRIGHPICCFGNVAKARVITVGVNPSKGEFAPASGWPDSIPHTELSRRCRDYFCSANSHRWFEPWAEGLSHLTLSYTDGSAAHLDLSPRATRFISDFKEAWEQDLFLQMVERDLWTFFGTLRLCTNARFVFMAGSVTGKYYINTFLQRFAPDYGHSLDGHFDPLEMRGNGKTAFHTLSGGGRKLQVFFCSTSPSARDKGVLPQRIRENARRLVV
jgi:hypothetical protein